MNYKILATVSAVALLSLTPLAMAETQVTNPKTQAERADASNNPDTPVAETVTKEDVKRGWNNTKDAVGDVAGDVRYTLFGKEPKGVQASITAGATARGLLDRPVHNGTQERVGTLRDIIIDSKGNAVLAVVSDSEMIDIGKQAAFDYSLVLRRDKNGDVVMPLTEDTIKNARQFSYDTKDAGKENVRTIPSGGYSIEKLMKANIVNAMGAKVASVDNITFRNGQVDALVVGFDKTLGMGGNMAALSFSEVRLVNKGSGDAEFQLTAAQSAQFETFKQQESY